MRWLISLGHGLTSHSAHDSLDEALRCVHQEILRGRPEFDSIQWEAVTGDDHGVSDGTLTMLSWDAPKRKMTAAEIDAHWRVNESSPGIRDRRRCARQWRECPPNVTDWDRTHRLVIFLGQFEGQGVESVSICREDRHRQYLQRAGRCNDVAARSAEFEALMNPPRSPVTVARKVLPPKGDSQCLSPPCSTRRS